MRGKPRFFCDHCGSEVPHDAQECPECGKAFASVRCPYCGFTGEEGLFNNGCPGCGYSVSSEKKEEPSKTKVPPVNVLPFKQAWPSAGTLPLWVYIVTGLLFVGMMVVVYVSTI